MRIWLDLPDDLVEQLAEKGQDLSRSALEALAIDAYRMNRITSHQLCQLLELPSRYELDGFLKHHGVPQEYPSGTSSVKARPAPGSGRSARMNWRPSVIVDRRSA